MRKLLSLALVLALTFTLAAPTFGEASAKDAQQHYTLSEVVQMFGDEISGDAMLLQAAHVYRGWRTSYGNWLDDVMVDLHDKFVAQGFMDSERTTANNQGDSVWYQYQTSSNLNATEANPSTSNTWNPQYVALKVVDDPAAPPNPERDALKKTVDFVADCIDPTSIYFPSYVTAEWLVNALKTPGSADYQRQYAVNNRCHMPTNGTFFAYTDKSKSVAENIAAGTKSGQVVYVGTLTASSNSLNIPAAQLAGKVLLTTTTASANVRTYCTSVGAIAALCRVSESPNYHMPEHRLPNGDFDPAFPSPDTGKAERWYTNYVPYTGGGGWAVPGGNVPVVLHYSLDEYAAMRALIDGGDTVLEISALGEYYARPVRCLVVEIQGATKPEERVYVPSHINEPGACDNASGVAMNYVLVSTLKDMIDNGRIARPERTLTFVWGDEITMTNNWEAKYRDEFLYVKGSIDLDMTGEDPAKTGGHMLIEKTPDPSDVAGSAVASNLRYRYGNFTYPGQTGLPLTYSQFIRKPDKFSLWTGTTSTNTTPVNNYPGLFLNDLYLQTALEVQKTNPAFMVDSNPYEGGSDHSPFVTNARTRVGAFIPALLTWHFTDYVYHSSCDTLDKLSVQEFHDVGAVSAAVAYQMANGYEEEAIDTIDRVVMSWETRLGYETQNTIDHYAWQMNSSPAGIDTAYTTELKAIADWSRWYIEAVESAAKYMVGGRLGTPYKLSPALKAAEDAAIAKIQSETVTALNHVDAVFGKNSANRPVQVATAYLDRPVFIPVGTTAAQMVAQLPSKITVEYIGGGTGEANVAWSATTNPTFSNTRVGLYMVNGTLSGLEDGVVNWAVVQATAEVNAARPFSASINAAPVTGIEGNVEFVLSANDAVDVLTVELEFEVDGNMLAGIGVEPLAGFDVIDGIAWKSLGGSTWRGTVTLGYPAGGDNTGFSAFLPADIAKFVFAPRAKGDATMKLTGLTVTAFDGEITKYIDAVIAKAEATTTIDQLIYSKYDLNKDNKVDALDLGMMLLYCGFSKDSADWGTLVKVNDVKGSGVTASMCDVNGDGIIDMLDLLDLFIHYTK
ncbi:MAG: dockerin type I domain-containing protein [Clostridiales bacterium]|nr:dockerin type I domain-containing protein [Clostridiales bacterium]